MFRLTDNDHHRGQAVRYNVNYALRQVRCQPIVDPELAFVPVGGCSFPWIAVIIIDTRSRNDRGLAATAAIFDRKYPTCRKILRDVV